MAEHCALPVRGESVRDRLRLIVSAKAEDNGVDATNQVLAASRAAGVADYGLSIVYPDTPAR